ncbi:MAG: cytochrome c oxidase subunit 4 [Anaerolineales bacterium]|jgi:cytochrome c oxidase subunit 1
MNDHPEIHMPSPSFWPIVLAFGLALIASGVIWSIFISIAGVVVLLVSIAGWALENRAEDQEAAHE